MKSEHEPQVPMMSHKSNAEICDPMSANDVNDAQNSTPVRSMVKCHGEPENHNLLDYHGTNTLSLWLIYITDMGKKMGRIS